MKWLISFSLLIAATEAYKAVGRDGKTYSEIEKCPASESHFVSAGEERDMFEINEGITGLIDGDIIPLENLDTRNTITNSRRYWPSTRIPVAYGQPLHLEAIGSIEIARHEYRLRTCLDFIDRTDERNYINFRALSGCFSSVGMIGLTQTISIGVGCERLGTVCHEMMHAIGIYHEQSRADRDDYVEIQWDIITPGYENNFNKYNWENTDARGLPYDYNSIMHYSDSGFSTTGDPTIVTRDPAFQDVIGQRTTFSRSDSEKINRMYNCSDTLLYSYNCNYDDVTECGYVQDWTTDNLDWLRYDVGNGPVGFSPQAPSVDATLGKDGRGTYMVLDSRSVSNGNVAKMRSKRFLTKSQQQCLQFSYYIKNTVGDVSSLSVHIATLNNVTGDIVNEREPIVTFEGNYDMWQIQRMTVEAPEAYKLVFVGTTSGNANEIIAIDDVSVIDKKCDDDFVEMPNYQNYLDTYAIDESFLTPVMVSEQGYNFRLRVYPNGRTGSADGYMSMSFGIVKGPNDDQLDWPFCNKYMKMSIVNKEEDPLYQQNRFLEYVTSQDAGGALWNKPNSTESFGYYGYYNYMKISDLTDPTKNFLKHGAIMFSVLIQDMNWVNGEVCSGEFTRNELRSSNGLKPGMFADLPKNSRSFEAVDEGHGGEHGGEHGGGHGGEHGGGHGGGEHGGSNGNQGGNGVFPIFNKQTTDSTSLNTVTTTTTTPPPPPTTVTTTTATTTTTAVADTTTTVKVSQHQQEKFVPVSKVIAFTIASSAFVLIVMSTVLCCVVKSHKKNLKAVANHNVTIHTNTSYPPACPEDKVTFQRLPELKQP